MTSDDSRCHLSDEEQSEDQADRGDEQHRALRDTSDRMDVRQQARQLTIARHRKQQPRSGRLRHQRIRDARRQGDRDRGDELERRPARDGGDGVEGVVDLRVADELGPGGDQERRNPGLHDEEDRSEAKADHRRLADCLAASGGLLGERRDGVEAEEGQHGDRERVEHEAHLKRGRTPEGVEAPVRAVDAAGDGDDAEHDEKGDHHELHGEKDLARPGGRLDPQQVDGGVGDDEQKDPRGLRDRRNDRPHRRGADDIGQGGQQQVVEQHRPSGQKAGRRVQTPSRVGVDGARNRKCDRHLAIADGGEDHRHEADDIGERHQASRGVEHDAEDREGRDRRNEDEAVHEQIDETQTSTQLGLVAELRQPGCLRRVGRRLCASSQGLWIGPSGPGGSDIGDRLLIWTELREREGKARAAPRNRERWYIIALPLFTPSTSCRLYPAPASDTTRLFSCSVRVEWVRSIRPWTRGLDVTSPSSCCRIGWQGIPAHLVVSPAKRGPPPR